MMHWVNQAIAILGLFITKMASFFIPIFFVMMVVMAYLVMITGLVRVLKWIVEPYLLLKKREKLNEKMLRKIKIKTIIKKIYIMSTD